MSLVGRPLSCVAVAALTSALLIAPKARADGGFPRAHDIFLEPGNPSHILIRSDFWGLFRSTDGGQSWQYACSELYGGNAKQLTRVNLQYLPGGRILVGKFGGLAMTDDYCNWTDNASLANHYVEDLVMDGAELRAVTADGDGNGGVTSALWSSTDNGTTWTKTGGAFPTGFIASSIRIAPSDAQRIYVGGTSIGSSDAVIAQSTDGGATWTTTAFTPPSSTFEVRVRAVHPTRPDVAFVWVDNDDVTQPDSIWGTGDAGATWTNVYSGQKDLPGLALSPDGTDIRIAGPYDATVGADGLVGATVDAALAQGPSAFQKVFEGSVYGLTWTADALYAGNNNFTAGDIPAFTLGKSTTKGASFTPLMNICSLEFATCGASSSIETTCHPPFDGPGGFQADFLDSDRCKAPPAPKKSSSCSAASPSSGGSAVAALGALAAVVGARRRRRRRP